MKTFVRLGSLLLALGLAGLSSGCTSYHSNTAQRARLAHDFEVVETSTKRILNTHEMAVLRSKVAEYLDKQGVTSSGVYYVKVFLGADQEGGPAEWVVVRFSRDMDLRFQLMGSDDNYYAGYPSYASYNVYPYGYDNFGRVSFQYYDEPYYGYGGGYYIPPQWRDNHNRNRDRDGDRDRKNDGKHEGDRNRGDDHSRPQDRTRYAPQPSGGTPPVTHTRWDGNSSGSNNPPNGNNFPRHHGTSARPQSDQTGDRTYTPPIRTSSQAVPRSESSSNQSAPSQPSFRTSSQSAPSYSAPAPRSESRQSSSSDSGPKESSRAGNSYQKQE